MIKIKVNEEKKIISKITISGHALYDEYGKDIVCAAVSATVLTTVNILFSLEKQINYQEDKDIVTIDVIKTDDVTNKILRNMLDMLKNLVDEYPKNIKLS